MVKNSNAQETKAQRLESGTPRVLAQNDGERLHAGLRPAVQIGQRRVAHTLRRDPGKRACKPTVFK